MILKLNRVIMSELSKASSRCLHVTVPLPTDSINQIDEESYRNAELFRQELKTSKHLAVLTGAGVSAESGIPTFRGAGGLWRQHEAQKLATPEAFRRNPSLVWQFYQYRRNVVLEKHPNEGHIALAKLEQEFIKKQEGNTFTLITQNIDGLHLRAGSQNVIQMHGNILETRCTKCRSIEENTDKLVDADASDILPIEKLPRCKRTECKSGLLRPNVVWFGESIDLNVFDRIEQVLNRCDLFLIIGTSGVVYPAANYGHQVSSRGITIAEFNIDPEPTCSATKYYFKGPSGVSLPKYLF